MVKNSLETLNWSVFSIGRLLEPKATKSGIDKNKLVNVIGNIPYITRTETLNGIGSFIGEQSEKYELEEGNTITIGLDTQTVFYQRSKFYTGQNIQILSFKGINIYTSLFIIPSLKIQLLKFNWGGNGATLGRLNKTNLLLPSIEGKESDYALMEAYIKAIYRNKEETYQNYIKDRIENFMITSKPVALSDKKWKSYFIEDVFNIKSGTRLTKSQWKMGTHLLS